MQYLAAILNRDSTALNPICQDKQSQGFLTDMPFSVRVCSDLLPPQYTQLCNTTHQIKYVGSKLPKCATGLPRIHTINRDAYKGKAGEWKWTLLAVWTPPKLNVKALTIRVENYWGRWDFHSTGKAHTQLILLPFDFSEQSSLAKNRLKVCCYCQSAT